LITTAIKAETYRDIILAIVLYGCETWFVALMERQGGVGAGELIWV
jgi:hypothetical protein